MNQQPKDLEENRYSEETQDISLKSAVFYIDPYKFYIPLNNVFVQNTTVKERDK